ncbi:MAG: CTP synthase [Clostridiales bacterium]|nr:CTP synthase [Clostridiales bacterium]
MDEMKIKSDWLRKLVSKYIMKQIKKKTGYDVKVDIGQIYVSVDDGDQAHVHLEVNADMNKADLEKIADDLM